MNTTQNYTGALLEEIALEGLDGISIEGLWLRLEKRPDFIFKSIDDKVEIFLWKFVQRLANVEFYELPSPRPPLVIYNNFDNLDQLLEDIYPHAPVEKNVVKGSCKMFNERVNVTLNVRKLSLDQVKEIYGRKLVLVADQNTRKRVLTVSDLNPLMELTDIQYCVLERIGRSRYMGEITQGKYGLQAITDDRKMLFYYRKFLWKHKLITKQIFQVAKNTGTCSLLHLTKFSTNVLYHKNDIVNVIQFLKGKPEKLASYKDIIERNFFENRIAIKKSIQKYPKMFKSDLVPYRSIYPNAPVSEWKLKSGNGEKLIRALKLIDSYEHLVYDDDEDDDDDNGLLDTSFRRLDRTLVRQCYSFVEQAGPRGLSQVSIGSLLAAPSLQARCLSKYLTRRNICGTALVDLGRQRLNHFFSKKFDSSKHTLKSEMIAEKNKLMEMISKENEEALSPPRKKIKQEKAIDTITPSWKLNVEETDVQVNITVSNLDQISDKSFPSLTGDPSTSGANNLTVKILKRANMILHAVNTHKVIHDPQKIQRMINEEEISEGCTHTVDRKTVQRLIDKLELDGHIRTIKVSIKTLQKEKNMTFICHPSIDKDHSEIQSAIEQAVMKLRIVTNKTKQKIQPINFLQLKYDQKASRRYGYKPKFVRMKILHTYMHYLIYGYEGNPINWEDNQDYLKHILNEANEGENFIDEMSTVYTTKIDWKMFIPPLPVHDDFGNGWCLISDLLLRFPLHLFMAVVRVPYDIPKLLDYLNHPIRRYFLIKNLPQEITNHLTMDRKYLFSVSEIISRLGYVGLLQIGPQKLKEKDQVFVYLNKHGILLDTTISEPAYNHISDSMQYETLNYTFNTHEDVNQYWYDLWNFAMNTNLGCRASVTGQNVVIESVATKRQLLDALTPRQDNEARELDVGFLPGDQLGAGGLDSDLFSHLKRNWYWSNESGSTGKGILDPPTLDAVSRSCGKKLKINKKLTVNKNVKKSEVKPPKTDLQTINCGNKFHLSKFKPKAKHRKITRIVRPNRTRYGRKPYYDQVDKEALRRMVKLRVDWSSTEDNLLLICKVASLFMSLNKKRQSVNNFCAVREILHTRCPELSKNKTSRACQRRINYMMKNTSTAHSVYMCLEEVKQDPEITTNFNSKVAEFHALMKSKRDGPRAFQKEYDKIFTNLVSKLLVKLKTITAQDTTLENISIPDTMDEFKKSFKIFVPDRISMRGGYNQVQNIVDIYCTIVNSVIHSSLCCTMDKVSYSYQLFYIYQQYPDKLLRSVMAKCRSMSIVSCWKKYKKWKASNSGCLPLSSSPYQLSITYVNILQTRFQYGIFSEAYEGLENILDSKEDSFVSNVLLNVNNGGECANMVELYSAGFVTLDIIFPEHLIVLDPRLSETEESYNLIMKRFNEIVTAMQNKSKKEKNDQSSDDDEYEPKKSQEIVNSEEFNLSNKSGLANTASRLALYMMRDEPAEHLDKGLQHAHDYFVLKPCKITVSLNADKVTQAICEKDIKKQVENNIKKLATFPNNDIDPDTILESIKSNHDEIISIQLLQFLEEKKELGATYKDIAENIGSTHDISQILNYMVDKQYILKTGCVHIRFVHYKFAKTWLVKSYFIPRSKREELSDGNVNSCMVVNIDNEEPIAKKPKLDENIEIESNKPGSTEKEKIYPKSILFQRKRKWVNLPKQNKFHEKDFSSMEQVYVSVRPWIRVDGTLNRRVLDRLLGSVLGHCLNYPGATLKNISERFTPALQPVHTYDLIEILSKLGCVKIHTIKTSNKVSLFSKRSTVTIENSNGFGDTTSQVVEPENLAISKLGHFIGQKSYKSDYLDIITTK